MNKKKLPVMILAIVLVIAVFAGIAVVVTKMTMNDPSGIQETGSAAAQETEEAAAVDDTVKAQKEAAEALIGQTLTRDEIEAAVGSCEQFDMNNNGCERGVYAGKFFYKGFSIQSRTYDKGKTFKIVSVN